ncbi:hypothetical protein [Yinghuangia sp. YIM S09857]|uniref:hypothetical protein n=1 Tax=Yinghuangia sp. YIM S09857 TaxID=3436929 RepID=UPI003F53C3DA
MDTAEPLAASAAVPEAVAGAAPEPVAGATVAAEVPGALPADAGPAPRPRRLRGILRWTSAFLVFAAVAGGATVLTTLPDRRTLPGLGTESDGRHDYPALSVPPIVRSEFGDGTATRRLYDIRLVLLPRPKGALPDTTFPGRDGWLATEKYLSLYADPAPIAGVLRDHGLRHIAADAWRTSDGMRTEVYLLHFDSHEIASMYYRNKGSEALPVAVEKGEASYKPPEGFRKPTFTTLRGRLSEVPDAEGLFGRVAVIQSGDVVAVVLTRSPAGVSRVPFDQAVDLQAQLLG